MTVSVFREAAKGAGVNLTSGPADAQLPALAGGPGSEVIATSGAKVGTVAALAPLAAICATFRHWR
jgi:hypothetical protein